MTDLSVTAASVVAGADAVKRRGTLGETVTAGQALYFDSASRKWKKADSNSATAAVRQATGIALNGGGDGQPVEVQTAGQITIGASLTAGVAYYLSDTPGGICPFADVGSGEYVGLIGVAISTTVLDLVMKYTGVAN